MTCQSTLRGEECGLSGPHDLHEAVTGDWWMDLGLLPCPCPDESPMSDAALIAEIREGWKLTEAGGPALAFLEARLEWLRSCVGVANIRLDDGINTMKARQAEDRAEIARLKALLAGVDRVGDD